MSDKIPELPKYEGPVANHTPSTGSGSSKAGGYTMGCGVLIVFFPLILAFFSTAPSANMWSEGDSNSGGSALWLMMLTIPLGFIVGIVGLAMYLVGSSKRNRK
jgi:hypothetical protein